MSIIRPDFKHRRRSPRYHGPRHFQTGSSGAGNPCVGALVLRRCAAAGGILREPHVDQSDQPDQTAASSGHIQVVDGDTVRSNGQIFRLVGFNTPESGLNAQCSSERALAAKATDRLQQLLAKGAANLQRVACACDPGTEGTRRCNHGRLCGKLTVDGRDVGSILIAEGLAERFECWATSCPRRKDWCRS